MPTKSSGRVAMTAHREGAMITNSTFVVSEHRTKREAQIRLALENQIHPNRNYLLRVRDHAFVKWIIALRRLP